MKKALVILALLLVIPVFADYSGYEIFIVDANGDAADIASLAASSTATNGSEFTAFAIDCTWPPSRAAKTTALIVLDFTGDGSMDGSDIDFYFQVSYDGGTTWTTDEYVIIDVASDAAHSSNTVIHAEIINAKFSHIRLWKVDNLDAANAITLINAYIVF